MKLIHSTGAPVAVGDSVTDFRGEKGIVESIVPTKHEGSSGAIYVLENGVSFGYYPSVYGLKWVEGE